MFEIHPDAERFGYEEEEEEEEEEPIDPWLVDETESGPLLDENGDPINPLEKIFDPAVKVEDGSSTVASLGGADDPPFVNPLLRKTEYSIGYGDEEDIICLNEQRMNIAGISFQIISYPHDFQNSSFYEEDEDPIVGAVGFSICNLKNRGEMIDQPSIDWMAQWSSGSNNGSAREMIRKFCETYEIDFDERQCGLRSIRNWCRCCT